MARKSEPEYFIGQDNGITSTVAILSDNDKPVFRKTPVKQSNGEKRLNHEEYKKLLEPYSGKAIAVLERPMINPSRFKSSISAAKCHEAMRICLEELDIPFIVIDSRIWQNPLFVGKYKKLTTKQASTELGNELFPEFKQSKHTDRDSLLMAYYAKNNPDIFMKKTQKRKKPKK